MDDRWVWAGVAVLAGLLLGAIAGALIRRVLDRDGRRPAVREVATPLSFFVFWLLVATGVLVAVAVTSPDRLETIPTDLLGWLPNAAMAGLLVIGGYALGLTIATAVGRALSRVSGSRSRSLESAVRLVIFAGAAVVALNQLGVDTTIVNILIGGLVSAAALALAGLSIVGGRTTAEHVAAGRALAHVVSLGDVVEAGEFSGAVVELLAAHLVLETDEGRLVLPYGAIANEPFLIRAVVDAKPVN